METRYIYDPFRRLLKQINTEGRYGRVYQNVSYGFDRVGNVLAIENRGDKQVSQSFGYDDLYQLVEAEGTYLRLEGKHHPNQDELYRSLFRLSQGV